MVPVTPRRPWSRGYGAERRSRSEEAAVRAAIASHVKTPPDILERLAHDPAAAVRTAVLGNPQTSDVIMRRLTHDRDVEVRTAAVRRYWLRHDRKAADDAGLRRSMADDPGTSAETLAVLAEDDDPSVRSRVTSLLAYFRGGEDVQPETLRALAHVADDEVRQAVARHRRTPTQTLRLLLADPVASVRLSLAVNEGLPDDLLRALAKDEAAEVRTAVALKCSSADQLARLACDEAPSVRAAVARNEKTSTDTLLRLVRDPESVVRKAVAGYSAADPWFPWRVSTPAEVLRALVSDEDAGVRVLVALNRETDAGELAALADDPDPEVGLAVAFRAQATGRQAYGGDFQAYPWARVHQPAALPPEALDRLADARNVQVQRSVADHHDAPVSALVKLADSSDKRTRRAAAAALAVKWFADGDSGQDVARIQNPKARVSLAQNRSVPIEVLGALTRDVDLEVRRAAAKNPRTPVRALCDLLDDDDSVTRSNARGTAAAVLTGNAALTATELDAFAGCEAAEVRAALARHKLVPAITLLTLAGDPDVAVREAVAQAVSNRELDPEALTQLAHVDAAEVRASVADAGGLPFDVLRGLAHDSDERVRRAAARGPYVGSRKDRVQDLIRIVEEAGVPDRTLRACARSPHREVREAVASHPDASAALLANMVRDEQAKVRSAVACNANAAAESLAALAADNDASVRKGVATNPCAGASLLTALAQDRAAEVRLTVASNPSTPSDALEHLASDRDVEVALAVALHSSSTGAALRKIISIHNGPVDGPASSWRERLAIAADLERRSWLLGSVELRDAFNASLPDLLGELRWFKGPRQAVASRENCPVDVLVELAQHPDTVGYVAGNPSAPANVLIALTHDADSKVRRAVASNPSTPAEALATLALDEVDEVREGVASHPDTPRAAVEDLCSDAAHGVRGAAERALTDRQGTAGL